MSDNDVIAVLIAAESTVRIVTAILRYRAGQKAADRKAQAAR